MAALPMRFTSMLGWGLWNCSRALSRSKVSTETSCALSWRVKR
ncbi:hypothetical protein CFBP1573P_05882 [Pseudomonas syringae pv. persicae]|nr:hypothetical protein ALQ90_200397 [Pseudomonas savastanoi pv. savastanoi]RMV44564.1 hypothetical protein ALP11_200092 [Pseudomonas syringae pv. papulans]SOQ16079.1 hypothetical protein CFBP1573P_05882 [Pseudomonas syringae pv. persicae]